MGIWSKAFARECHPIKRLTGSEWAQENRVIASGTSPEAGRWRNSRTPYLVEPMDSATDRKTEIVVLCCSSQVGKSELLLNVMGYYADQEPSPQLMLQPTVEMAEAFSKERIEPMFRSSLSLRDKLEEGKDGRGTAKKSSTTIRMKHFPGGYLALVGANSPAGLASRPIRVLLCDEIDRYGVTKEGDPLKLAIQRTQNFGNRKIVLVSTPTIKGVSKIDEWFQRSDKREFRIKCPHCGFSHALVWENVKWLKDENEKGIPETAKMFCPECGAEIRGSGKPSPELLSSGQWVATADSTIKGYSINALASPWVNLSDLVEEFLAVNENKDKHGLMEFLNLKLGQAWENVEADDKKWQELYSSCESYPPDSLPEGVLAITCGVDVQRDRLEATVYGWGEGHECWGISHNVFYGRPDSEDTWAQLDELLSTTYNHPTGAQLRISCTCVDSGDGVFTNEVYRFTKAREGLRVFAVKGRGGAGVPFVSRPTKAGTAGALLFTLGVDSGKQLVMNRLGMPNAVHYDRAEKAHFTQDFFKQLTAETLVRRYNKGVVSLQWAKIRERNEALDTAVYATAAREILNPNYGAIRENLSPSVSSGVKKDDLGRATRRRHRGTISNGISF